MKYIYPQFPIIHINSGGDHNLLEPGLRAAIYIISHHFSTFDDSLCIQTVYETLPLTQLRQFVLRYLDNSRHRPTITSLQSGLLLAISPAANMLMPETDERAFLAGTVTAMANALGLQHDPSDWEIPEEEKVLRRRLTTLVRANDTWTAFAAGRPPFIASDNWSIDILNKLWPDHNGEDPSIIFLQYAQLTEILSCILHKV
jgi:hypothetical protein